MTRLEYLSVIIPVGRDNAIRKSELCKIMKTPDRETRLLIERLRRSGMVICSDDRGYYRPQGIDELRMYCRRCRKRRRSDYRTNRSAEQLLKQWEQESEFDGITLLDGFGGGESNA